MKCYKIVIFIILKISAKLKLSQKSYEALQESPFNKGAVSEADWGFLYLFSIFRVFYCIIDIFTYISKIFSYFFIGEAYYFYFVCIQYICSYFIIFFSFFCIMLASIYFYSDFLFRTIKI